MEMPSLILHSANIIVLAIVALLQMLPRPTRVRYRYTIALIFGVLGLYSLYQVVTRSHESPLVMTGVIVAALVLGAVFGVVRAWSVRLWTEAGRTMRQGTWLTLLLWVLSFAVHYGLDWLIGRQQSGSQELVGSSTLLWFACTLFVQAWAVQQRANRLVRSAEPGFTPQES